MSGKKLKVTICLYKGKGFNICDGKHQVIATFKGEGDKAQSDYVDVDEQKSCAFNSQAELVLDPKEESVKLKVKEWHHLKNVVVGRATLDISKLPRSKGAVRWVEFTEGEGQLQVQAWVSDEDPGMAPQADTVTEPEHAPEEPPVASSALKMAVSKTATPIGETPSMLVATPQKKPLAGNSEANATPRQAEIPGAVTEEEEEGEGAGEKNGDSGENNQENDENTNGAAVVVGGVAVAAAAAAAAAAVSVPVVEVVERAAPTIPTVAEAPTPTPATTDLEIAKAASVGGTLALGAGAGDDKVSTTAIKSENFSTLGEENMLPAHAAEGTGDHATRGGPGADHGLAEGHVIAGAKHTAVHSQEETTELQSLRSKAEQLGIPHEVSENLEISELKELVTRMEEMNAVLHEESALLKEQELKLKRETLTRDIERWGEANRELEGEVGELDNHIRELHRRLVESGNDDLLDEQAKIEWGSVKSTA